ncbi:MAG: choice-of-anchor I family protein, partial [Ruminiclostridium sp.]
NGYAYAVSGVKGKLIAIDINVSSEGEKAAELAGTEYDVKKLISGFAYGDMTSVAVSPDGSRIAVAIQAENYADKGAVALFSCGSDGSLTLLSTVIVGVQPDMVTFANNNTILTADEGEPRDGANAADPKGSVTIVTIGGDNSLSANSVYLDSFDEKRSDLTAAGVLVQKGKNPSEDFEPEYIAVSGNTAFVSLQEANAVAVLDIAAGTFTGVYPLGFCDYGATKVDLQKNDKIELNNYENVLGIRMPDGISVANIGGKTYLLTANEGDSRADWAGMDNEYENKTSPTGNVTLDKKVVWFNSTMWDGLDESKAYVFGGRSFSIYEATANGLTLVYDSGSDFEAVTANKLPDYFNASNDKISIDNRSGKKGPEPESVVTGIFGEKTLAFIALERIGGIMVYDISEPANAKLVNYINSREFDDAIKGDVSPEGLCFVAASDSKSGKALLLAACEVSGTLAVYQLDCAHTPEELYSKDETGHWKNCTACGEKLDFGAHISDGGVVTTAPTSTTSGLRTYSCKVCGYVIKTETIPQTGNPQIPSRPNYPANNTNQSNNQTATTSKNTFTKEITAEAKTEGNSVTISWDKVDNADKYIIYRYKDGKYVKVKETTDLSVTFGKLKNGTTYEYMVKYSVGGKVSPDKFADKLTVKVNYKPVVKATAGKNSARLSWKAVPGAEKYAVYKYVNGKAVKLTETEKTAVTIRKLKSGKKYSYIVRAYVDGKWTEMKKSDVVTVKVK